ncbi:MAG: carboxypeptidase regulatory-like domain-containing protein, partial [Desulfuromonadales bacterium]|nr:carboxypeptidase regulatory-like domain-containing protein [Desulfuromonadales bacterium]
QAIPGVLVRAENARYAAAGLTGADGGYSLSLPEGVFDLYVNAFSGEGPSAKGYLASFAPVRSVSVDGASSGNDIVLMAADALARGRIVDWTAMPVPGVPLQAVSADGGDEVAYACSGSHGEYSLGLLSGHDWHITLLDDAAQPLGLVGTVSQSISIAAESSVSLGDLTVYSVNAWLKGVLTDVEGQPIADVPVVVSNSDVGTEAAARTSADGSYQLGMNSGNCEILIQPEVKGYNPAPRVAVTLASGQTVVQDFTLTQPDAQNTIVITEAVYNLRKQTLSVTASSTYPDAQLSVDGFGSMTFVKLFKGAYVWDFDGYAPSAPATVTVSGAEGSATESVTFK